MSGDFIPDKSSTTSVSQPTTTTVNTTTTTTVRDIGLTGQNAVDLAAIIGGTEIARSEVFTKAVDNMFSNLGTYSSNVIDAGKQQAVATMQTAENVVTGNQTEILKLAMLGIAAVAAIITFKK